jgi:hypothetical protein
MQANRVFKRLLWPADCRLSLQRKLHVVRWRALFADAILNDTIGGLLRNACQLIASFRWQLKLIKQKQRICLIIPPTHHHPPPPPQQHPRSMHCENGQAVSRGARVRSRIPYPKTL